MHIHLDSDTLFCKMVVPPCSTEFLPIIWRWVEEIAIVVMQTSDERISTQRNTRFTWTKSVIWILMQSLRSLLQEKYKFLPAKYRRYPFKFFMSVCTNTCRVYWYVYVLLWVSMARQCVCAWLTLTFLMNEMFWIYDEIFLSCDIHL